MGIVDVMSPPWRALAYYFGRPAILMYVDGVDLMVAWGQLEARKLSRQEQQLATDYFPKTNRGRP